MRDANEIKNASEMIKEQMQLLIDWNKIHAHSDPEQVRRNIETLLSALAIIEKYEFTF